MSFQLGGLMSGLDTKTMIDQLMALERRPVLALEERKETIKNRNSAFQLLNTRLASLQSRATDLLLEKTLKANSATSSDSNVATASAGAGAAAGTYKIKVNQLATATSAKSSGGLAAAASDTTALMDVKPASGSKITAGTFTIGGATFTIAGTSGSNVSDNGIELKHVLAAINMASGNLGPDGDLDGFPDGLADYDPAKVSYTGSTGLSGGIGVDVADLTADGQIRLNVGTGVAIGGGADTSNFLTVAGLKSPTVSGATNEYRTGARMNATQASAKLNASNFAVAVTGDASDGNANTGTFKVNGTSINYDLTVDSLNDVLSRINSSQAGVVASYNAIEDRVILTNKTTGSTAISLEDVGTGNFLAATKLTTATQTAGQNAQITIDGINGGNPIESSTNEFKDVIPGVNFTAKKTETASWTTVTVARDYSTTINSVKAFITEFNTTVDTFEAAREKGKPLQNDGEVSAILGKLRQFVYDPISGLSGGGPNTLSALGIGTTKEDRKHLSLDETKFKAALEANPDRVAEIFNKDATATNPTGMAGRLKKYLTDLKSTDGVFATRNKSVTAQTKLIDDQIRGYDVRIEQRRKILTGQFTAMEQAIGLMRSQQNAMLSQLGSLQQ